MAGRPLRPATDHRFGRPLPCQLANPTRSHLSPMKSFLPVPCGTVSICGINSRFQLLSPCERQVLHAFLTHPPLSMTCASTRHTPLDLHVLGTPPAFILSQDRTLLMISSFPADLSARLTMKLTSLSLSQFPVSFFTVEISFENL